FHTQAETNKTLTDDRQRFSEIRTDRIGVTGYSVLIKNIVQIDRRLNTVSFHELRDIAKPHVRRIHRGQTLVAPNFERYSHAGLVEFHGLSRGVHAILEELCGLHRITGVMLEIAADRDSPRGVVAAAQLANIRAVVTDEVAFPEEIRVRICGV